MTTFDRLFGLRILGVHQFIYERSGGRIGRRLGRIPMLLLHTTGRQTALPRTVALLYHRDGDRYIVVGSKGGSDSPPAWLLNLQANPDVEVQVGTRRSPFTGQIASPAERRRMWPEVTRLYPQFDRYQSQTKRSIPLVILTPKVGAARLAEEGARLAEEGESRARHLLMRAGRGRPRGVFTRTYMP